MGTVVLCRNFSGGALVSRWLSTREIRTAIRDRIGATYVDRLEQDGLKEAAQRLDDCKLQALPLEFETRKK
jgi:hypothetical protein